MNTIESKSKHKSSRSALKASKSALNSHDVAGPKDLWTLIKETSQADKRNAESQSNNRHIV